MKKLLVLALMALMARTVIAGSGGVSVGGTSLTVLGVAGTRALTHTAWATGTTYTAGEYVGNEGSVYLCLLGGTSSNVSFNASGDVTDGTVVWRRCMTRPRAGFAISNDSTNNIYISFGYTAVVNQGVRLNLNGGSIVMSGDAVWQGEVDVVSSSASTNSNVSTVEW